MISDKTKEYYLSSFIQSFIKPSKQALWSNLLKNTSQGNVIDLTTWDFWDEDSAYENKLKDFSNINELKKLPEIIDNINRVVILVKVGHENFEINAVLLSEILNFEIYILEGIVIIDPQKLSLVFNHSGDIRIALN